MSLSIMSYSICQDLQVFIIPKNSIHQKFINNFNYALKITYDYISMLFL